MDRHMIDEVQKLDIRAKDLERTINNLDYDKTAKILIDFGGCNVNVNISDPMLVDVAIDAIQEELRKALKEIVSKIEAI